MSAERVDVLAYGVTEREGGPIVALKYDREDASDWIVSASSEYRNRQMPGPSYRVVELIDRAAIAELIEADREYDEAREACDPGGRIEKRLYDAIRRRAAALERCGGAK